MFKNMKLGTKLLISFLLVGVIPFAVISIISLFKSTDALSASAYNQLIGLREIKKTQIENFFAERQGDMGVLVETVSTLRSEAFNKLMAVQEIKKAQLKDYIDSMKTQLKVLKDDPYVREALSEFDSAFEAAGDKVGSPQWEALAKKYDPRFKDIMADNGWYDLFLIHTDGDIVYTATREADLGMIIPDSELKDSPLGKAFDKARKMGPDDIALADLAPYSPSGGAPAGFMMAQLRKNNGELTGYVAFQMPLDKINEIMLRRDGMGKTGESYLVGPDYLMRSDSFLDPKGHSVKASFKNKTKVETKPVKEGLSGRKGREVILDYNGNPVLSVWDPVDLGSGVKWVMMSEIDVAEAFSPVDAAGVDFYKKYIEQYGYYDLFLVNPDGYVFYTVTKESDYQTNMVSGKFKNSGLGKLVQRVLETKKFSLADFEPYAPSAGDPAAFIAQPVVHTGKVELVVALQLSLEAINRIMQQRQGLGQTGETYLIGPDKLMRSDSFLDPTNHSVKASFANPQKGSVDTNAARAALSGKTGAEIVIDYNGNPVLSAYTPVKLQGANWALLAEIDESEAFAAINSLKWAMGIIAVIAIAAIIGLALVITTSITRPINRIIDGLNSGADQVAAASSQVSSASQSLAEGASEQAASLEQTTASMEEMSSQTKANAENAGQADVLMKEAKGIIEGAGQDMTEMASSMQQISEAGAEIGKIVKSIDEIAFQTNLLALNAAVEAARAGEAGMGFAVVADEVRALAMRAAEAAKNTQELVEQTVSRINQGSELVEKTQTGFSEITESAGKVAALVAEISSASKEQSQGIGQVNTAMVQMDQVTQQVAANAEESASSSEELSAQASTMKDMVLELVSMVTGAGRNGNGGGNKMNSRKVHLLPQSIKTKARATTKSKAKEVNPRDVIPFEDDELGDF